MRPQGMSAGGSPSKQRSGGSSPARNEAGLYNRNPRRQLLLLLGASCGLLPACLSSAGRSASLLAELAAPGLSSPADLLERSGTTAGDLRSTIRLGRSVRGAPLVMDVFGDGPDHVLVVGGMHGSEPAGAAVAERLARLIDRHPEFVDGCAVAIIARVNPDGLLDRRRTNANGADLNRNFPSKDWRRAKVDELSHGRFAASEPETLAVMRAVEVFRPHRIIDIHSIMRGCHGNNYDGPAEELAELMSRLNGYPVLPDVGYPTPGSLGNWAGVDRGIPTITLELPGDLDHAQCWRDNAAAVLAFIRADLDSLGE
jgi:protein MpaA